MRVEGEGHINNSNIWNFDMVLFNGRSAPPSDESRREGVLQASVKWCNSIIIFIFMFYSAPGSAAHTTHTVIYVCVSVCDK